MTTRFIVAAYGEKSNELEGYRSMQYCGINRNCKGKFLDVILTNSKGDELINE